MIKTISKQKYLFYFFVALSSEVAGIRAPAAGGATEQLSQSSGGENSCPLARAGGSRPRMTTGHGRPDKLDRKLEGHAGETREAQRTKWRDKLKGQTGETREAQRTKWRDKLKGQTGQEAERTSRTSALHG